MNKFFLLLLISVSTANCQDFGKLKIIASLPNAMKEVSGIEMLPKSNLIWMVDDHGNAPKLYGFNPKNESFEKVIEIANAKNEDWEDLTSDSQGNLYIGDFGNNGNKRRDLCIYKVQEVLKIKGSETNALKTTFTLEDQDKFPPKKEDRNFDIESFFFLNDNFYLFTRNRSKNFDGTTKLYKLPAQEGEVIAKLIGVFKTCGDKKDCEVTSAAINANKDVVAILTYDKVFLFSEFKGDDFFNGKVQEINLDYISQKESITFKNKNTLYIADERNGSFGGNLYELSIKN